MVTSRYRKASSSTRRKDYEAMQRIRFETYLPEAWSHAIDQYKRRRPIFDLHGIEDEIRKALERNIPLKSGGYLIFDQTEAMTTIDVNTGGYVGHRNLEETIYRTNLEAAVAIARQLRLRNLGGIIIIDFIDMEEAGAPRQRPAELLEESMARDHARHQITPGIAARPRRDDAQNALAKACSMSCAKTARLANGRGFVMTAETVCFEIFREIIRQSRQFEFDEALVLAHQDVIDLLLDEQAGMDWRISRNRPASRFACRPRPCTCRTSSTSC